MNESKKDSELQMRHFCSTTTKPECLNWKILARKGLQEQPGGVQKRRTRVLLFFLFEAEVLGVCNKPISPKAHKSNKPNMQGVDRRCTSFRPPSLSVYSALHEPICYQTIYLLSVLEFKVDCLEMIAIYRSTYYICAISATIS